MATGRHYIRLLSLDSHSKERIELDNFHCVFQCKHKQPETAPMLILWHLVDVCL